MNESAEITGPYETAIKAAALKADELMGDDAPTIGQLLEIIQAYEEGLNQPIETAPQDGKHLLGWQHTTSMWRIARCVPGSKWLDGFSWWRPMPPAIKEEDIEPSPNELMPGSSCPP